MRIASPPPRPLPDLTVRKLDADHTMVYPGDQVSFSVDVKNQGTADSGPFNLLLDAGFNGSLKVRLEGLVQGGTRHLDFGPVKITDWAEYQGVEAFADSDKEVEESKERNNKKSLTLYFPQPHPPGPPFPPVPPVPPHQV